MAFRKRPKSTAPEWVQAEWEAAGESTVGLVEKRDGCSIIWVAPRVWQRAPEYAAAIARTGKQSAEGRL
jgi:hypothetical protein